jgi:hypothetical protein
MYVYFSCQQDTCEEIVNAFVKYVFSVIGHEVLWLMRYSECPPGFFPGILQESTRAETLQKMKTAWECLELLETRALDCPALQSHLRSLVFPGSPWVRDVLIAGNECNFEDLPTDIEEEIKGYAKAHKSTKPSEDAFNVLRDGSRLNTSGAMGRARRYHTLIKSNLLSDIGRCGDYGRACDAREVRGARKECRSTVM